MSSEEGNDMMKISITEALLDFGSAWNKLGFLTAPIIVLGDKDWERLKTSMPGLLNPNSENEMDALGFVFKREQ